MREVLLATRSEGKLREIEYATANLAIKWRGLNEYPELPDAIEDGATFRENALRKAAFYSKGTGLPALADDSGLIVDLLGGRPGVDSATYAGIPRDDGANNQKLLAALRGVPAEKRTAHFHCQMIFYFGGEVLAESYGEVDGRIIDVPRGSNGFGYDPIFFIPALGRTAAELTSDEKNLISHRGIALRAILPQMQAALMKLPAA
ncbi:MAG: non-canonical purine NTP pyrophosphatase [Phycisphaerales bacterium]|nr:non-canonical purine NTP pyrophosphatase [Phycisphaerales bacterium]